MSSYMTQKENRQEAIMNTLDRLRFATRSQIQTIHGLGTSRNALKVLNAMSQYLEKNNFKGMNVYSLNAAGKDFIGSDLNVKFSTHCEHYLMRNDLYIHYGCPKDWKIEAKVTFQTMGTNEQYVKPDARFFANDTWHYIEIDRTQSMVQNRSKIDQYAALSEIMKIKLNHKPMIIFYTTKESRQEKIQDYCKKKGVECTVYTLEDLR